MKSFNDTIAAGEPRRKRLLLAAVQFFWCFFSKIFFYFFVLSALPHPVSEGSGLKSRSGPLDQTRRSGPSANHKTWLPQKVLLRGQMTHSRGMTELRCQLRRTHTHARTQKTSAAASCHARHCVGWQIHPPPPCALNAHNV